MKATTNIEVRKAMKAAGMKYADLAAITGKSEPTVYRMLQAELSEEDKNSMMELIRIYAGGGDSEKMKDITLNALEVMNEDTNDETAGAPAPATDPEAELLAMMEEIKKIQRTPTEDEARKNIIIEMGNLNNANGAIEKELQEIRRKYRYDYVLPIAVENRMRELKNQRTKNKDSIENLKMEFCRVSDAAIDWEQHRKEQAERLEAMRANIASIEAGMKRAEESGHYDEFKAMEKELFSLKADYKNLMDRQKHELKPDTRHEIEKKVAEFSGLNRRAMVAKIEELKKQINETVYQARQREIEMSEYAENFMQNPFTPKNGAFNKTSFICSFYQSYFTK